LLIDVIRDPKASGTGRGRYSTLSRAWKLIFFLPLYFGTQNVYTVFCNDVVRVAVSVQSTVLPGLFMSPANCLADINILLQYSYASLNDGDKVG
jgi:hypothetical protein